MIKVTWIIVLMIALVCMAITTSNAGGKIEITSQEYGEDWPFTVSKGTLECKDDAVIFHANGSKYAVNGTAQRLGALRINPIWKDNPAIPGTKISVGPLISRGLDLCK